MTTKPAIFYAVLNWGLGHASRSIPVITALLKKGLQVHLASDGYALDLLTKTFPELPVHKLPSLEISYQTTGKQQLAILQQSVDLMNWYKADKAAMDRILKTNRFSGIITDNRPGVYQKGIPSVYLTHQISMQTGITSPLATLIHKQLYKNFNQIWIPDYPELPGLAGELSHKHNSKKVRYVGALSDLKAEDTKAHEHDIGVILSGPEPQRSLFEEMVINQLMDSDQRILLIRGTKKERPTAIPTNWLVIDFAGRDDIKNAFETCKIIIARSGYSTLMDLYHYPKPALLVPTPGQPEQEFLATMKTHKDNFAIQKQDSFSAEIGIQEALQKFRPNQQNPKLTETDWEDLFLLFQGK